MPMQDVFEAHWDEAERDFGQSKTLSKRGRGPTRDDPAMKS